MPAAHIIASLAGASLGRAGGAQDRGAGGVSSPPGHTSCRRRASKHCGAWGCVVPKARRLALCGVRPGGCGV